MCFNQDHKNLLIHMLSISCHCGLLKRVARLLKEAAAEGDLKKKIEFLSLALSEVLCIVSS